MNDITSVDTEYDDWHSKFGQDSGDSDPWHQLALAHLDAKRDLQVLRVLEIGCGRGGFSSMLARKTNRPKEIIAADFSATAIDIAENCSRKVGIGGINWIVADIQDIPFPDSYFDTVFSFETIEHVPNPEKAVRELARVLKPNGRLILTVPNYFGAFGLYRLYLRCRGRRFSEEGQPINNFTMLPQVACWFMKAGLRLDRVDGVGHYLFWPGRQPKRVHFFDRLRFLTKWFAYHSCLIGFKK